MSFCTNCGCKLAENAKFCFECGAAVKSHGNSGTTTQSADIEMGVSVVLDRNNGQDCTENKVYVPHEKKTLAVKIPNSISIGQIVRLRGAGNTSDGKKGDLLIRIDHIEYKEEEPTTRKVGYDGVIRKCPNCGDIIDAYETVCETCGYEIRGRKTTSVVHELGVKLEYTDDVRKKDELIRTFYIPNTKEDIHEFFILALSNIKIGGTNTDAWMVKLEQAYQKAELSFSNTQEFERLKTLYQQAQSMHRNHKTMRGLKLFANCFKSGYAWAILFVVIGGLLCFIGGLEESGYTYGGMACIVAAMWIGLMTMINNEDKRKNKNTED